MPWWVEASACDFQEHYDAMNWLSKKQAYSSTQHDNGSNLIRAPSTCESVDNS